jgi:UDP-N-acetylglucosamine 2-epimerase (non-hydrolysing)
LRENTERPQTISVGANCIAGLETNDILKGISNMLEVRREWTNPLGDGKAAKRIVKIVKGEILS